ncbi:MAG: BadF/BadG/BcrA/BcrD ATPase family protein [Chthonomonadales bacterium]
MPSDLYLGVDGGQSTTVAVLLSADGAIVGTGVGGPANHIHEPGGVSRIKKSIRDAVGGALRSAGVEKWEVLQSYFGMTGSSPEMESLCREALPDLPIMLGHDSEIALMSTTLGGPGLAVIGGTGSVAIARDGDGRTVRAGGWGYLMGDEGSAYWIALRALEQIAMAADGRVEPTPMLEYSAQILKVDPDAEAIHRLLYGKGVARVDLARISEGVWRAASDGDQPAADILREAGVLLGMLGGHVIAELGVSAEHVVVGMVGGVFRAEPFVREAFSEVVQGVASRAKIVYPRVPASVAAGLLAMQSMGKGLSVDSLLNLEVAAAQHKDLKR